MNFNFVKQHAPELAPTRLMGRAAPTAQVGIMSDEPLYDAQGMPLSYIQQGGQREYFGTPAEAGLQPVMQGPQNPLRGLRGFTPPEQYDEVPPNIELGLRGSSPPMFDNGEVQPQDLLRNPLQRGNERQVLPLPPPLNQGVRARVPIPPPLTAEEDRELIRGRLDNAMRGLQDTRDEIRNFRAQQSGPARTIADSIQSGSENLGDFLTRHGLNWFDTSDASTGSGPETPLRGRVPSTTNAVPEITDYNNRANEIAHYLTRNGISLTTNPGRRTRNAAAGGGHPDGNAIDIRPHEFENAMRVLRAPNSPYRNVPMYPQFIEGGRTGRGWRSTGDHYHVYLGPAAERRLQRQQQ